MAAVFDNHPEIPNQFVTELNGVSVYIKREDLLHPHVSGNKFRKLKYNLKNAISEGHDTLLTFGGAFSNHIAATAAAGKECDLKTIGVIRGEELGEDLEKTLRENPTLNFAASCGMEFEFVSRSAYREKTSEAMLEGLRQKFGSFYHVPEGGTNLLAVKGCEEILSEEDQKFDVASKASLSNRRQDQGRPFGDGIGGDKGGAAGKAGTGQRQHGDRRKDRAFHFCCSPK